MNISTNEFSDLGNIMIIPVFEHTEKAPNNTTIGLSRSASIAIKSAISSERCDGKEGSSISIWTKDCQIILSDTTYAEDTTLSLFGIISELIEAHSICFGNLDQAIEWVEDQLVTKYSTNRYKGDGPVSYTHLTLPTKA